MCSSRWPVPLFTSQPSSLLFPLLSVAACTVRGPEGLHFLGGECRHRSVPHVLRWPRLLSQQRPARHLRGVHALVHVRGGEHSHDAADREVIWHLELHERKCDASAKYGSLSQALSGGEWGWGSAQMRGRQTCPCWRLTSVFIQGHTLSWRNNNKDDGSTLYRSCECSCVE